MVTNHARKSPGHCSTGCATSWAICGPSWSHPDGAGSDPSRARRAASGHRAGDLGCARRRPACRRWRGGEPDDGRAAAGRGLDVVPTGSDTWEPCRPVRCTSSPPSTSSSTSTSRRCSRCSPRHRALRPGGLPVAETPNPTNLVMGACNLHPRPHPPRPDPARAAGVPGLLGRLRRDTGVPLHPKEDVDLPGLALPGLDEAASALVAEGPSGRRTTPCSRSGTQHRLHDRRRPDVGHAGRTGGGQWAVRFPPADLLGDGGRPAVRAVGQAL
jgi:hypothetical protein